jgi:hypothetical protein
LLRRHVVDASKNNQFVHGKFVFFALQAIQPASRNPTGLVAPLLRNAKAPFFNLSQRELPVPTNRAKSDTDAIQERSPLADPDSQSL